VPAAAAASHHAGDTDADLHIAEGATLCWPTTAEQAHSNSSSSNGGCGSGSRSSSGPRRRGRLGERG
jgi:hypothetical protein